MDWSRLAHHLVKMVSGDRNSKSNPDQALVYQIRLEGHLGHQWANWLNGLSLTLEGKNTLLTCQVVDQAALYGLLRKVRDLGVPLLSVTRVEPDRLKDSIPIDKL